MSVVSFVGHEYLQDSNFQLVCVSGRGSGAEWLVCCYMYNCSFTVYFLWITSYMYMQTITGHLQQTPTCSFVILFCEVNCSTCGLILAYMYMNEYSGLLSLSAL